MSQLFLKSRLTSFYSTSEVVGAALNSVIRAIEVERPIRQGSQPFAPQGPELVEGLDPKPLNVRATDPKRVGVNSLHLSVDSLGYENGVRKFPPLVHPPPYERERVEQRPLRKLTTIPSLLR